LLYQIAAVMKKQPAQTVATERAHRIPIALQLLGISLFLGWQVVRLACCAVLVLMEPVLRATLVPTTFLGILGFRVPDWPSPISDFRAGACLASRSVR
jgi:hypothetical protein